MKTSILGLALIAAAPAAAAQESPLSLCTTLSFAPLDMNVPACTALIEAPGGLAPAVLGEAYAARAEAYRFAVTYHGKHDVQPMQLLASALADLDKAVAVIPVAARDLRTQTLQSRGELREQLGDRTGAVQDYRAVLTMSPDHRYAQQGLDRLADAH